MKTKNKITLLLTSLWAILAALQEAGVFDIMPFTEETNKWIKWTVAVLVVIANATSFQKKPQSQ